MTEKRKPRARPSASAVDAAFVYSDYQLGASIEHLLKVLKPETALIIGATPSLSQVAVPGVKIARAEKLDEHSEQFACVASCDALPLLPESERSGYVEKLCSLAGRHFVLISPFDSPAVRTAEKAVADVHKKFLRRPHEIVAIHQDLGLPSLGSVCDSVASVCGTAPRVLPCTALRSWALFEMMGAATGSFEREHAFYSSVSRHFNHRYAPTDHGRPAYRRIVLGAKPGAALSQDQVQALLDRFENASGNDHIRVVREVLRGFLGSYSEALGGNRTSEDAAASMRRVEDLESKVRAQAETIERLHSEIFALKSPKNRSKAVYLLRKLFKLKGATVDSQS